jgi:hypothetical protein
MEGNHDQGYFHKTRAATVVFCSSKDGNKNKVSLFMVSVKLRKNLQGNRKWEMLLGLD